MSDGKDVNHDDNNNNKNGKYIKNGNSEHGGVIIQDQNGGTGVVSMLNSVPNYNVSSNTMSDNMTVDSWGGRTEFTAGTAMTGQIKASDDGTYYYCAKHPENRLSSPASLCTVCEEEFRRHRQQLEDRRQNVNQQLREMSGGPGGNGGTDLDVSFRLGPGGAADDILKELQTSLQQWKSPPPMSGDGNTSATTGTTPPGSNLGVGIGVGVDGPTVLGGAVNGDANSTSSKDTPPATVTVRQRSVGGGALDPTTAAAASAPPPAVGVGVSNPLNNGSSMMSTTSSVGSGGMNGTTATASTAPAQAYHHPHHPGMMGMFGGPGMGGPPPFPQPQPPGAAPPGAAPNPSSLDALAVQIQRMQQLQDWVLWQKEQECVQLKSKLEAAMTENQSLRVDNALLREKLHQQEQRMQHELKLIKLAAYHKVSKTQQQQQQQQAQVQQQQQQQNNAQNAMHQQQQVLQMQQQQQVPPVVSTNTGNSVTSDTTPNSALPSNGQAHAVVVGGGTRGLGATISPSPPVGAASNGMGINNPIPASITSTNATSSPSGVRAQKSSSITSTSTQGTTNVAAARASITPPVPSTSSASVGSSNSNNNNNNIVARAIVVDEPQRRQQDAPDANDFNNNNKGSKLLFSGTFDPQDGRNSPDDDVYDDDEEDNNRKHAGEGFNGQDEDGEEERLNWKESTGSQTFLTAAQSNGVSEMMSAKDAPSAIEEEEDEHEQKSKMTTSTATTPKKHPAAGSRWDKKVPDVPEESAYDNVSDGFVVQEDEDDDGEDGEWDKVPKFVTAQSPTMLRPDVSGLTLGTATAGAGHTLHNKGTLQSLSYQAASEIEKEKDNYEDGWSYDANGNNKNNKNQSRPLVIDSRKKISFPDDAMSYGQTAETSTYGEDREAVRNRVVYDPYGDKGHYSGIVLKSTGLPHGQGKMIYQEDNRTYEGEWRHGRWHGFGRATFANGDEYEGEYRYDQRHGRGRYRWSDGRVFDGIFREDKRHGKGRFEWPDGAVYEGGFLNGQREGHGVYKFSDGGRYEGGWKDGRYNGFGICSWQDGRTYKGEWSNGMAHGKGIETFADGTVRHDGLWIEDEPVTQDEAVHKTKI